jgi:type I restriction enzyme S subunit
MDTDSSPLRLLLEDSKDGDWGQDAPSEGTVPYRVVRGADFPSVRIGDLSGVPVRFLRSDTVHRRTLRPDDLIFETAGGSRDRPTGRTLLVTERMLQSFDLPVTCASFCRFLRPDRRKIIPQYLFWYLQYLYAVGAMWEHQVQHTGVARFQYTRFAETVRIPIPDRCEQNHVVRILGALEERIELNHRMNQTLEAMARAIFKSWFVDFDPVREGHSLFPGSLQGPPVGHIPKGWQVKRLGEICGVAIGGDWGEDEAFEEAVEVVCLRGVDLEHLRVSGSAQPPRRWISSASLEKRRMSEKDVLIAASGAGPIGRPLWASPAIMKHFDVPVVYSNFCKRLTTGSSELAVYLDRVLFNLRESGEIFDYVVGTSVPNLDLAGLMRSHKVLVPPPSVLQSFARLVIPILERLYSLESRTLAALRDALLPKLLSGEIRVKQAETIVGEVA